ncbi:MAG: hypothetical protein DU429_02215 [Candidatus Tokpelaia sp.]|nr:MAG: hypothetical protein DU430_04960 [Candidatus Tokpelaia sp.]KAA6205699.1 MAG: hypothetical protein DU430_03940 [Candidatus Tokpelaia sp.]KAA6207312.1 MAG: hypothetical protein DU429_02215 [Candidatus Tokpelaia sp.]
MDFERGAFLPKFICFFGQKFQRATARGDGLGSLLPPCRCGGFPPVPAADGAVVRIREAAAPIKPDPAPRSIVAGRKFHEKKEW